MIFILRFCYVYCDFEIQHEEHFAASEQPHGSKRPLAAESSNDRVSYSLEKRLDVLVL